MRRIVLPAAVVATYEGAGERLQREWTARASPETFGRFRASIGKSLPLQTELDAATSRALARRHDALPGYCYWNARSALLLDPSLRRARYTEGIFAFDAPLAGREDVRYLGLELQGWLEGEDGRVIDPTPFSAPASVGEAFLTRVQVAYVPVLRFTRDELVGQRLPRMMHTPTLCLQTFAVLNRTMFALSAAATATEGPSNLRRALTLFAASLAMPWQALRERVARGSIASA